MHSKVTPTTLRLAHRAVVSSLLATLLAGVAGGAFAQGLRLPGSESSGGMSSGGATVLSPSTTAPAQAPGLLRSAPAVPAAAKGGVQMGDAIVAVVNSEAITRRELEARVQAARATLASQQISAPDAATLERQVLERMIVDRTQLQEAATTGIRIDDFQLDRAISRIAEQNKVTVTEMRDQIEREGLPFAMYREDLRQEITLVRLRERAVDSLVQVSESEIDNFLTDQNETAPSQLTLAQILVRVPEGSSSDRVAELRRKAEALQVQARGPVDFARLAAASSDGEEALRGGDLGTRPTDRWPGIFIEAVSKLKPGEISNIVQSGNGFHIVKLVDRKAGGSGGPVAAVPIQQTQARHILIRTSEIMSNDLARQRLADIRQRVLAGNVTFAEMARQYSNDASAPQGGDLGWLSPSETVPEFERVMNELKPGDISEPIQTPFGWHLIQVTGRRTQDVGRERQRAAARQTLFQRKVDQQYEDWARQLRDRAYVEIRLGGTDAPLN
jgi:peptidyl-prolyl cis-trans isomerase SurA